MHGAPPRLGDLIDDYCPRCRLLLNHAIASMVGDQVAKVICQTCLSEHAYLHAKEAKKKAGGGRETLFDQVLATSGATAAPDPPPEVQKRKPSTAARYVSRPKGKRPRSKS